jgi:uroporphyrinogen-III synthase
MRERDDVAGSNVLYVTAEGARDVLPAGLRELSASLAIIEAYRTIPDGAGAEKLARAIEAGKVDLATFTSASAVRGYIEAVGEELALKIPAVSIGPQTSDALRDAGIEVEAEAEESSIDGLVAAVLRAF